MSKIRVYEIAKELGLANNVVIDKAKEAGIAVENHLSYLDEDQVLQLRTFLNRATVTGAVVETRVAATVLRRRPKRREEGEAGEAEEPAAPAEAPAPTVRRAPRAEKEAARPEAEAPVAGPAKEEALPPEVSAAPEQVREVVPEELPEPPVVAAAEPEAPAEKAVEPEASTEPEAVAAAPVKEGPAPVEVPPAIDRSARIAARVVDDRKGDQTVKRLPPKKPQYKAIVVSMPDPEETLRLERKPVLEPVVVTEAPAPALDAAARFRKKAREDEENARRHGKRLIYDRKKEGGVRDGGTAGRLRDRKKKSSRIEEAPQKPVKRTVKMGGTITVGELANGMAVKVSELMKKLLAMGIMATVNQVLDFETAALIAQELGHEVINVQLDANQMLEAQIVDKPKGEAEPRPPVVTIMGHVDHGKTSLLDVIQKTNIAAGEAGGITQAIGAYVVKTKKGQITFIDTPGHEAFTAMRARGAKVTDIVVLVVAADDGVMPQTVEAINHAKSAKVPIVVAVNKMDKQGADPQRVKQQLTDHGLLSEDWGGTTMFVEVSAKKNAGIQELLDGILLQAEVMELHANPNRQASGIVLESKLDKGRGPVATVLVQDGTLNVGDLIISGSSMGKIRAMADDKGRKIKTAGPSIPVEVLGFNAVPAASDPFNVITDDKVAKTITELRGNKSRQDRMVKTAKMSLESFFGAAGEGGKVVLRLVLKADSQGTLEATRQGLSKIESEKVRVEVIHEGVGGINENDVNLAAAVGGFIVGFNVRPDTKAKNAADQLGVELKLFALIHELIDTVKAAMEGALKAEEHEVYLGQAEIREVFSVPKVGKIAGCYVTDGKIKRSGLARLVRGGTVVWTGKLASLKRFKDDAREVMQNFECGVSLENYNDIKVGDIIEVFEIELVAATLE